MPASTPAQKCILVVEDNANDADIIRRALEQSCPQFAVRFVPGALEAFAYLSGSPPYHNPDRFPPIQLVLLDVRMPRIDGFEVLRWIRHNPALLGLPVIMLTGGNDVQDMTTAYRLGATSFFVKPFDFSDYRTLCGTVERLMRVG